MTLGPNLLKRIAIVERHDDVQDNSGITIVKVYGVQWDGTVCSVSDDAVYKHEDRVVTRGDDGRFHYDDGIPIIGLVITVNGDVSP